jgi:dihydroflavonol-4-reductase
LGLLFVIATGYEAYAKLTGRPILISLASVRLLARENERSRMNHDKSQREIGVSFRPFDETLADTVAWYRNRGDLPSRS